MQLNSARSIDPIRVLMVGPSPSLLGGMSTVVQQILEMGFHDQVKTDFLAFTMSEKPLESVSNRIFRQVRQVWRIAERSSAADLVHFHTCSGFTMFRCLADAAAARIHGCKIILHIHGAGFDSFFAESSVLHQNIVREGLESADAVIALSESWCEKLRVIAPASRVIIIENAVSSSSVVSEHPEHDELRLLMLARMDLWKGVYDLLDALNILQRNDLPVSTVLAGPAGTAGNEQRINEEIARRGIQSHVRYVGPVVGQAKTDLLHWANVLVQPSRQEGMPLSMLEGMAAGLCIVSTRVGAVSEVITEGVDGVLVAPGDPRSLSDAIGNLRSTPNLRRTLGRAGWEKVSSCFGLPQMEQRLLSLYQSMI